MQTRQPIPANFSAPFRGVVFTWVKTPGKQISATQVIKTLYQTRGTSLRVINRPSIAVKPHSTTEVWS